MQKKYQRTIIVSTLAAALVLGGALGGTPYSHKAFAEEASAAVPSSNTNSPLDLAASAGIDLHLDQLVGNSSLILDIDYMDMEDALKSGSSLNDIAKNSMSLDNYAAWLIHNSTAPVDTAFADGTLSDEQVAQLKSVVEAQIRSAINQPGYQDPVKPQAVISEVAANSSDPMQTIDLSLDKVVLLSTEFLDLDFIDVEDALKDGKTLASLAKDAGKTEAELKNQLLAFAMLEINNAMNQELITADQADQLKTKADEGFTRALETPGYQDHTRG